MFCMKPTTAGAEYLSLMVHNPWWRTIFVWYHTSSLSLSQALRNADGSYTFVISPTDPDVHNRIDTAGLHDFIHYLRSQGLPGVTPHDGGPEILSKKVIRMDQLRSVLSKGTRFYERPTSGADCAPAARREQEVGG